MSSEPPRRRYDSLRRTLQAQATSVEIAQAARRLFVTQGWAATTVREVAREAGVSVPTVYSAYGNKTGLVQAVVDAADLSADAPRMLAELEAAVGDPPRQLAAMAGYDRRLFERAADVIALVREAARTEPDLATTYLDARRRADDTRIQVFTSWPDCTLREDLATSVDIYAALCTIDVFTTLTAERGWSPDRVETWWTTTLSRELLA
ncbi:TetR/AcrR family transcriptional regulator [Nocardia sp. NPDC060259]|uniref:TetR/AcrR family transcriptional regulator n=1 Tax=Nocardia sp. NPDC060259 TaxID=3347088 RepID=UPI00365336E4